MRFPEDKEELLSLVDQGNAQPFHAKTCAHCHGPTKYADWQSLRIRANQLSTAYSIDYYSSYEPFYIARTSATPYYDERFKAYGYDRISQVCEMHVKGKVTNFEDKTQVEFVRNFERLRFSRIEQCLYLSYWIQNSCQDACVEKCGESGQYGQVQKRVQTFATTKVPKE